MVCASRRGWVTVVQKNSFVQSLNETSFILKCIFLANQPKIGAINTAKTTELDKNQYNGKNQPQNDGKRSAQFNKSFSTPINPENSGFAKPRSFRP